MFSRLYIATQVREGGIQKLFNHETSFPLSKPVKKIGRIKYYFLSCIKTETEQTEPWTKTAVIRGVYFSKHCKTWNREDFYSYANNSIFTRVKKSPESGYSV